MEINQQVLVKEFIFMAAYCIGRKSACVFVSFLLPLTLGSFFLIFLSSTILRLSDAFYFPSFCSAWCVGYGACVGILCNVVRAEFYCLAVFNMQYFIQVFLSSEEVVQWNNILYQLCELMDKVTLSTLCIFRALFFKLIIILVLTIYVQGGGNLETWPFHFFSWVG